MPVENDVMYVQPEASGPTEEIVECPPIDLMLILQGTKTYSFPIPQHQASRDRLAAFHPTLTGTNVSCSYRKQLVNLDSPRSRPDGDPKNNVVVLRVPCLGYTGRHRV